MAYVYRHIRLDKNQPFYIGIGSDENYYRSNSKSDRNVYWKRIVAKTDYDIDVILDDLTWEEACEKEKEFIKLYGRFQFGGLLCNMTDGGEGGLGVVISNETREKKRVISKGIIITAETREKMAAKLRGRPLPLWQKKLLSEAAKNRKRKTDWCNKPIEQYDLNGNFIKEYESIIMAANELGASHSNICAVLKGRRNKCKGFKFKYKI
jgi:hypothetical protein